MATSTSSLSTGLDPECSANTASSRPNAVEFWNRLSQQMSYIDGSTHSSSLQQRVSGTEGSDCSSVNNDEYPGGCPNASNEQDVRSRQLPPKASASWTYCECSYSSVITSFLEQTPPDSPLVTRGRSVSCNQNHVAPKRLGHYDDLTRSCYPDHRLDGTDVDAPFMKRNQLKQGNVYNNFLNDDLDDAEEREDLEMELLQPLAGGSEKKNNQGGVSKTATTEGSSAVEAHRRACLHRLYHKRSSRAARVATKPDSYNFRLARKRTSSWEESETIQRRRSLMLAASLEQCPVGSTGIPPGRLIMPTGSQLDFIDKRDLKYYFQHPYPRLFVTYFVIFCNFLLFAEDPISHSHKESDIPIVGNVFSFVVTKYPPEWRWSAIKVLMWILAMLCGMIIGKLLIHSYLFGRLLRLKMFRDDQGSWMTMFLTVIVSLFVFSHAYNILLQLWYHDALYQITSQMGVSNASVMKAAATGTWLGDLITALMVTDMMLQDNLYPHWAPGFRRIWRKSNIPRILIFWVGSVLATSIVVTLIVSDWISWDKLNKDFISTNEISRAFLASSILVMDLLIVMQDWDFPNFTTTLHVNLPGMNVATLKWKYAEVDITGKWFNYGIIFLVMMLDLNMWKNQIFYNPKDYGQYRGPDDKVRTVSEDEILRNVNITYWTWESRSHFNFTTGKPLYLDDALMNSRYMGYPLSAKWTAFIPSIIGLVMFVTLVTLYGRFPSHQSHPRDRPADECRDLS